MTSQEKRRIGKSFRRTQIGLTGLWLLILYPVLLWVVVGTLSAYGYQDKIGTDLSIPMVMRCADQLKEIDSRRARLESELADIRVKEAEAKSEYNLARQKANDFQSELMKFQNEVVPRLRFLMSASSMSKETMDNLDDIGIIGEYMEKYSTDEKVAGLMPRYRELVKAWAETDTRYFNAKLKMGNIDQEIDNRNQELDKVRKEAEAVLLNNKVRDYIAELDYMNTFRFVKFATMPSQLLTLILTLSMGALGSLICITHDYFVVESKHPFAWYLFRPFLGMVTAVAVYVLAKAGQLTISDVSASQSLSENLNPFFISFLGIISGLLSEQATERIRSAGGMIFQGAGGDAGGPDRWAVGLEAEIKRQGKTAAELAPFVDVPEKTIEEWLAESKPVPAEGQQVIAAWLGVPVRKLFTDVSPASTAKAPGGDDES